jgi:hypothetical protein
MLKLEPGHNSRDTKRRRGMIPIFSMLGIWHRQTLFHVAVWHDYSNLTMSTSAVTSAGDVPCPFASRFVLMILQLHSVVYMYMYCSFLVGDAVVPRSGIRGVRSVEKRDFGLHPGFSRF